MNRQETFWARFDAKHDSASIEIVNIPPTQIVDYVHSMKVVYTALRRSNPDMVFFPDRGSDPLLWTIEAFEEQEKLEKGIEIFIPKATLPIGTHTDLTGDSESGYNSTKKEEIIREEIRRLRALGHLAEKPKHIVLIDEAQSGHTSATATKLLHRAFDDPNLLITYLPCKDERRDKQIRKADYMYKSMAGGEMKNIEGLSIPVPLFFIDRNPFLDTLIVPKNTDGSDVENEHLMQMKINNVEARKVFRNITMLVLYPEIADVLVSEELDESTLRDELKPIYRDILEWAKSILNKYPESTDSRTNEKNSEKRKHIVIWFRRISEIVKDINISSQKK